MYKRKKAVAMILAGGQGSRLYSLTDRLAKPAVPFGGKYRIIDFTLSSCVNSGIDTVGVLTQYQPLVLNEYIGSGAPWDLDRNEGGLTVLPPYQAKKSSGWYRGTANAIYQNISFINRYSPDNVLVLSGDHVYKMDYLSLIRYHEEKGAAATVAVIDVPKENASRFGIMSTDSDGRITEFEEKPQHPKSTLASMGIYVFDREKLIKYLEDDNSDTSSSNDFGKNVIPNMLLCGEKLFAYRFYGYWKDVGTVQSYWEANMDLLGDCPLFDVQNRVQSIYSRSDKLPPAFIGSGSSVKNSIIGGGCKIYGEVQNSVLFGSVYVEKGAKISDSVIFSGSRIGKDADIKRSIICEGEKIEDGVSVGTEKGNINVYCSIEQ